MLRIIFFFIVASFAESGCGYHGTEVLNPDTLSQHLFNSKIKLEQLCVVAESGCLKRALARPRNRSSFKSIEDEHEEQPKADLHQSPAAFILTAKKVP